MASRNIIIILLLISLVLSASATYMTITKFNEAQITGSFNKASVGLLVEPARKSNVGVTVVPLEEWKEE